MSSPTLVTTLAAFIKEVRYLRKEYWCVPNHKELWFRGENKKHDTFLRPNLYRPVDCAALKPFHEVLEIENDLYEKFMEYGAQLTEHRSAREDKYWDWYFLMQHHAAPNRLLDWTDGALIALHFAIRDTPRVLKPEVNEPEETRNNKNPRVYVLEPIRMQEKLESHADIAITKQQWKEYLKKHVDEQYRGLTEEDWEEAYLPRDEVGRSELSVPRVPLLLIFERITRRIAAQRSQFMVFGTDPSWLAVEFAKPDAAIKEIEIDATATNELRLELRESGITESVIFPDLDGLGRELSQLWKDRV